MFKLEGPAISAAHGLSTGQHARVAGRLATAGAALAHGARSSMARLTVSSLSVLKSSARKGASNHAGQPGTSGGPIQTSSHRLRRLRQVSAAPPSPSPPPEQQRLPVSQVPLQAADLPALVLPISFEGCDAPGGGQYGQPWYRPEVRPRQAIRSLLDARVLGLPAGTDPWLFLPMRVLIPAECFA